jgi:type II secretory pathway pseudopilin PulG
MAHRRRLSATGFSLVETTIVLSVLTLLTSVMAPAIGDYVAGARLVKARSDMDVIGVSIARFVFDVTAQQGRAGAWSTYDALVGAGQTPAAGARGAEPWVASLASGRVATIDDHLVTNDAGYPLRPSFGGSMFSRGWAGPYLGTGVGPDPWGNRYAVSVRHLVDGSGSNTVVISAGANGVIETPYSGIAAVASDDLVMVIAGGR